MLFFSDTYVKGIKKVVKGDFQRISTTIGQIAEQNVLGFYLVEAFAPF